MNDNTFTVPGKHTAVKTTAKPSPKDTITLYSSVMKFEEVKHLLSEKPLKGPVKKKEH